MSKLKIIAGMAARSGLYGGITGALCGIVVSILDSYVLYLGCLGIFWGCLIGLGIGIFAGVITGLILGGITITFFYPLVDAKNYRFVLTLLCIVLVLLEVLVLQKILTGELGLDGVRGQLLMISGLAALVFAQLLASRYIKNALRQSVS
jgi:hypothetical protein